VANEPDGGLWQIVAEIEDDGRRHRAKAKRDAPDDNPGRSMAMKMPMTASARGVAKYANRHEAYRTANSAFFRRNLNVWLRAQPEAASLDGREKRRSRKISKAPRRCPDQADRRCRPHEKGDPRHQIR
jgi:hypothetical protein